MNRLTVTDIESIGAVSEGDNEPSKILFYKKRDEDFELETESHPMVETEGAENMAETEETVEDDGLQELVTKQADELEKTRADLETATGELETLRKEHDENAEELAKERQARRDAEFTAKAEELVPVLGDAAEWAPILDTLEETAPEVFEKITTRLLEVKGQIESADIFKELGRQEGARTVDALVKSKLDGKTEMTEAEARAEVWRENPDLVEEARSESEGA